MSTENPPSLPLSLPFAVPLFEPGAKYRQTVFQLWGWHPNYPYWSESCWKSDTEEGARKLLPHLHLYVTALVRCENGQHTVVDIIPPDTEGVKVWEKIAAARK